MSHSPTFWSVAMRVLGGAHVSLQPDLITTQSYLAKFLEKMFCLAFISVFPLPCTPSRLPGFSLSPIQPDFRFPSARAAEDGSLRKKRLPCLSGARLYLYPSALSSLHLSTLSSSWLNPDRGSAGYKQCKKGLERQGTEQSQREWHWGQEANSLSVSDR